MNEDAPISDRTWLRAWLDSEFRNINKRLDQQQIEIGKMRAENKHDHTALNAKFDKLDGKVDVALTKADGLESRADIHDKHHGKNDAEIARRLLGIETDGHDGHVAEQAVAAYKARFRWLGEVATDARKVITVGIASSLLVAVGYIVGHI